MRAEARSVLVFGGAVDSLFLLGKGDFFMSEQLQENRLAVISMFVENIDASVKVNALLHEFSQYVVGRMGIPCRSKEVSVISVIIDAPSSQINALCGKLGSIEGIKAKSLFGK